MTEPNDKDREKIEEVVVDAVTMATTARDLGFRISGIGLSFSTGLDRLRGWSPVSLRSVAEKLSPQRLTNAVRDEIITTAKKAIREARTWRALGQALGTIINAVAARYGA